MTDTATDLPKLLTDAPAKAKEDLLGFQPHADRLADLILKQIPNKASFVIGIEGEWGEGKSSFINLLKAAFPTEETDEARPTIVDFNPWWFEGSDQLLRHFFDELLGQIDRSGRWTAPARKFIRGLAGLLDGGGKAAQLVPDPSVMAAGKTAEKAGGLLKKLGGEKTRSAQVLKASSKHVLEAQRFKTIVFIDDLDRLPAREIVELFRVIKAVADLPNIVYVIAYDRAIVASALNQVHEGRGEAYLEKIVQLPYRLPKPTRKKWQDYNFDTLIKTGLLRHGTPSDEEARFSFDVISQAFLTLPRDAKRLLASVHVYQLIPEEIRIDPFDFLFLEALRLKDRRLWEQLLTAILSVRELILMPRGGKSAEELFATWLQAYIPMLKETKPAVRDAIQYFTGWQVGGNKELAARSRTSQRLSRLASQIQIHRGYRSWEEEIDVLLAMVRAYQQAQSAENQFSNEVIEQFLLAGSLSHLAASLPKQGMKSMFLYEVIGFLQHRMNFSFDLVRHATLVAEYLDDGLLEETALLGYLSELMDDHFAEEIKPWGVKLNDEAKIMVTDWLVSGRATKTALLLGFRREKDWSTFKSLAVDRCLGMGLQDLLFLPNPVVTALILEEMGSGEAREVAAWESRLPEGLSDEEASRLQFMFSGDIESKRLLTDSSWLTRSARFTNLVRQLPRDIPGQYPWDAFLQKATV